MPHDDNSNLVKVLKTTYTDYPDISEHKINILFSEITGLAVPALKTAKDYFLSARQKTLLKRCLKRLSANEPVQYITGKAYFYGMVLAIEQDVLIPRPETEGLVEWIAGREKGPLQMLGIGTGSGAIALALKACNPEYKITATDISKSATRLARRNAAKLNQKISFIVSDLFPRKPLKFDVIVSNPPYISALDWQNIDEEIRLYEPILALLARERGLEYYRRIICKSGQHLNPGGKVYFEIGETQTEEIKRLAEKNGFLRFEHKTDLAGKDRYLCISR